MSYRRRRRPLKPAQAAAKSSRYLRRQELRSAKGFCPRLGPPSYQTIRDEQQIHKKNQSRGTPYEMIVVEGSCVSIIDVSFLSLFRVSIRSE